MKLHINRNWILIWMAVIFFSLIQNSYGQVSIIRTSIDDCLQETTLVATGEGPITFRYLRDGVLEAEDVVASPDANNYYISSKVVPDGSYIVEAIDRHGNKATRSLNVNIVNPVGVEIVTVIDANCNGVANGQAILNISSNLNFTVKLFDKSNPTELIREYENTGQLNNIPAGEYIVEVRDIAGCVAFAEIIIEEPEPLEQADGNGPEVTHPVCENDLGSATTRILGGNGPEFSYQLWKDGALYRDNRQTQNNGQITETDLEPGTYFFRVFTDQATDDNCFEDYAFQIVYAPKFTIQPTPTAITCYGEDDGSARLTLSGTLDAPFSYTINGGSATQHNSVDPLNLIGLEPGDYTVAITDADGCQMSTTFSISEPAELGVNVELVNDVCFDSVDGAIRVRAQGGTAPYMFSLENNFAGLLPSSSSAETFEDLAPGSYTVYVMDANGCLTNTDIIQVREPEMDISYTLIDLTDPNCPEAASGSIEIEAVGGWGAPWTYEWVRTGSTNVLSQSQKLENVPAGDYTLTLIDANGCHETFEFTLTDPESPIIEELSSEPTSCHGDRDGSIFLRLQGSEPYLIGLNGEEYMGTEAEFTGLEAGEYTVTIQIAEGCMLYRDITVGQPDPLVIIYDNNISPLLCYNDQDGGVAGLRVEGGNPSYDYQWEKQLPGGQWESLAGETSIDISGLGEGTYRLVVTDRNDCEIISNPFTFEAPSRLDYLEHATTDPLCFGETGSVEISLEGGTAPYYYSFEGNNYQRLGQNGRIDGLAAGDYELHIRDENGCTLPQTISFAINQPEEIKLEELNPILPTCEGGNDGGFEATVTGGSSQILTYEWFLQGYPNQVLGTSLTIDGLQDGNYFLRVIDPGNVNCYKIFGPFAIESPPAIQANVRITDVVCQGDESGVLDIQSITGGNLADGEDYQVTWTGPNGTSSERTLTALPAGTYDLTITDGNTCLFEQTYTVSEPENRLTINTPEVTQPGCSGSENGRIEITASNGVGNYDYSWQYFNEDTQEFEIIPGQTSRILSQNVKAGTYLVTVADGFCEAQETIVVNQPEELQVVLSQKEGISCFDRNDGFIEVDILGGSGDYQFRWSNGQTNQNIYDLRPGNYTLEVFDANGCKATSETFNIAPVPRPSIQLLDKSDVVCEENSGKLQIGLGNGLDAADFNIHWLNLQTNEQFGQNQTTVEGLNVGFYQVFVSAGEDCVVDRVLRIEGPESPLTILTSQVDPTCPEQEGAIYLNASGGFAPYDYFYKINESDNWSPLSGSVLTSLDAGDYLVMVRDAKGCEDDSTLTITQPNAPSFSANKVQDVSCYGGNDGVIDFSVTGASHQWYKRLPGQNPQPITDSQLDELEAGTYYMEVTFAENCTERTNDIIIQQPNVIQASLLATQLVCYDDLGSVTFTVSGGKSGKSLQLISGSEVIDIKENLFEGNFTFRDLAPGDYELLLTDEGCGETAHAFAIHEVLEPTFADVEFDDITCRGAHDGVIRVLDPQVESGRNFTVRINGQAMPAGQTVFTGLAPGQYNVALVDSEGCGQQSKSFTISQPEELEIERFDFEDPTCFEGDEGWLKFRVSGGNGNYEATLLHKDSGEELTLSGLSASATHEFENLRQGEYLFTLLDEKRCPIEREFELGQPDGFTVAVNPGTIICIDGSTTAQLNFEGGTAPFTMELTRNGEAFETYTFNQRINTISNLPFGQYAYEVTDGENCLVLTDTFELEDGEKIEVEADIIPVSCGNNMDGKLIIKASGSKRDGQLNYSYFVNGQQIFGNELNVRAGTYTITAGIGNSTVGYCESEPIEVVVEVTDPILVKEEIIDVSCRGGDDGSILLEVTGGTPFEGDSPYRYHWDHTDEDTPFLEGLTAGLYRVEVEDFRECRSNYLSFYVGQPEEELLVVATPNYILCNEDGELSITLEVSGGTPDYTYEWSNGATTKDIFGIEPGMYEVTVTDDKGCTETITVDLPNPAPSLEIESDGKLILCSPQERGNVQLTVNGGTGNYTYKWSNGSQVSNLINLPAGDYTVTVKDTETGCEAEHTVEIVIADPIIVETVELEPISCFGMRDGRISVNVSGGLGDLQLSWRFGDPQTGVQSPLYEFEGATELTNLKPGNYILDVEGEGGCRTSRVYTVADRAPLNIVPSHQNPTCNDSENGSINLEVTGGSGAYTYRWENLDNPDHWIKDRTTSGISGLETGRYRVRVEDGSCSISEIIQIQAPEELTITSSHTEMLACNGAKNGVINNVISGGVQDYTIEWSDASNIKTWNRVDLEKGEYTLLVTDKNGCTISKTYIIDEPEPLVADLFTRIDVDCETREVVGTAWVTIAGGTGEYEIQWSSGEKNVREVTFNSPDDISVFVRDKRGCNIDLSRVIDFPPVFADADFTYSVISLDMEGEILVNDPIQFNDESEGHIIAWDWDFGDGNKSSEQNPKHTYAGPGTYEIALRVYDEYGCSTLSRIEVEVTDSYRILIPNAFTPNGDGLNDTFMPKFRGLSDFEMHIFNTWGELLYTTTSMEDPGWNGFHQGKPSPNGNYVYKIYYTTREGKRSSRSGVFLLIN
ncbi:gliding motility-associated C-terminal domain-containing protein [Litoribacter alkaliphilus]|uniref:Gliding motility-associated C-terminal domain-containing protein n=1 Tax=Litoribacter ruber TaxID=702568 RepID=A0AAP2CJ69_9BACT|nr:gliding motility-associated C-terminal domain-containing protein [Litoribacter alkaliphilus]MBS9523560.1 gliding motility-associated C-terminal domain-containing protein [Litoribacter alkaliphilus]